MSLLDLILKRKVRLHQESHGEDTSSTDTPVLTLETQAAVSVLQEYIDQQISNLKYKGDCA